MYKMLWNPQNVVVTFGAYLMSRIELPMIEFIRDLAQMNAPAKCENISKNISRFIAQTNSTWLTVCIGIMIFSALTQILEFSKDGNYVKQHHTAASNYNKYQDSTAKVTSEMHKKSTSYLGPLCVCV